MDVNNEILVTEEGYKALIDELEERKSKIRYEISERIKVALQEGDLSENAEYHESKEEQNKNESRIIVLEHMLKSVRIVKPDGKNKDVIQIGSRVRIKDLEFDEELVYNIVGQTEADPLQEKISNLSPLGKELMGKRKGDLVTVASPAGQVKYQVLEVS